MFWCKNYALVLNAMKKNHNCEIHEKGSRNKKFTAVQKVMNPEMSKVRSKVEHMSSIL